MSSETQLDYRDAVIELAKWSNRSPPDVAAATVITAATIGEGCTAHVGYHLLGAGRRALERQLGAKPPLSAHMERAAGRYSAVIYVTAVCLISCGLAATVLANQFASGVAEPVLLATLFGLMWLVLADPAEELVHSVHQISGRPCRLPRMADRAGNHRDTLTVVPWLLTGGDALTGVGALARLYAQSRPADLRFCLLTDFADAAERNRSDEEQVLDTITSVIGELNLCHGRGEEVFLHVHRNRVWDAAQQVWTGRERKRGKLSALNTLLRGGDAPDIEPNAFREWMGCIRYILVLDGDSEINADTLPRLAQVMDHPLNRPRVDTASGSVVSGYAIAQPAVWPNIQPQSLFTYWGGNRLQHTPDFLPSHDVHQDCLGEGAFFGKALYHLEAFERVTKGAFPEGLILSHDLPEGCLARVVNVSNCGVFEPVPQTLLTEMRRRSRWIRGDWQNLLWLLGLLPPRLKKQRPPLTVLSGWKIVSNVRRDLAPVLLLTLIFLCVCTVRNPAAWIVTLLAMLASPLAVEVVLGLCHAGTKHAGSLRRMRREAVDTIASAGVTLSRRIFDLLLLPFIATVALQAVFTSTWRVFVSGRRVLEWSPSGFSEPDGRLWTHAAAIAPSSLSAAVIIFIGVGPQALSVVALILAIWVVGPLLAWSADLPVLALDGTLMEQSRGCLASNAVASTHTFGDA